MGAAKLVYMSCKAYQCFRFGGGIAQILKNICRIIYACDISFKIKVGRNLQLPHQGLGTVIGPDVIIGDDVTIYQNVTLGSKDNDEPYAVPTIGNDVMIGAGTVILGGIKVGSHVKIGANSVVLTDIPDNSAAAGVPARVIRNRKSVEGKMV